MAVFSGHQSSGIASVEGGSQATVKDLLTCKTSLLLA